MRLNKNIKIIVNYFLGPLVFLFLFYFTYRQLISQENWIQCLQQIGQAFTSRAQWKIWTMVALMPVNCRLEAMKWKFVNKGLQSMSCLHAFKSVLACVTIASFTPNRMGEYVGRVFFIEEGKRIQSVPLSIICSIAQLLVTLVIGIWGLFYFQEFLQHGAISGKSQAAFSLQSLALAVCILLVMGLLIYFRIHWLVRLIQKANLFGRYFTYVKVLKDVRSNILLRILYLSLLRYLIFVIQYGLLFSVFGVELSWIQLLGGMSLVFLILAVVPSLSFLTDLGLRWVASMQIIKVFSTNTAGIFATSFGIWLINLIIPALLGSLLILSTKIFSVK